MSTNWVFFLQIRCRRIGHCLQWSFIEILCHNVDINEFRCLQIGTNVVSIRRHRRIRLSTNWDKIMWCQFVDIDESGCLPVWLSANRSATVIRLARTPIQVRNVWNDGRERSKAGQTVWLYTTKTTPTWWLPGSCAWIVITPTKVQTERRSGYD